MTEHSMSCCACRYWYACAPWGERSSDWQIGSSAWSLETLAGSTARPRPFDQCSMDGTFEAITEAP